MIRRLMMTRTVDLTQAKEFIWHTARLIDRLRFAYHFLEGSADPVLVALRPYQNEDGGFGNGLEPDIRAPLSQPQPVELALRLLDEIEAMADPMVRRACDYLLTITTSEGGVPFVLPSVRAYPRAPWWQTEDQPAASLNPTAAIAGLLHKHQVDHLWLARATDFCWGRLETLETTEPYEFRAILPFLDYVPDRSRAETIFAQIGPKLFQQKLVELDPAGAGEAFTPLNYAPQPETLARRLFSDEIINRYLEALVAAQQPDGGWTFNWPDWNPATGLEWRGFITVEALLTLRAYGRLCGSILGCTW
jgi:hypothetical protein